MSMCITVSMWNETIQGYNNIINNSYFETLIQREVYKRMRSPAAIKFSMWHSLENVPPPLAGIYLKRPQLARSYQAGGHKFVLF